MIVKHLKALPTFHPWFACRSRSEWVELCDCWWWSGHLHSWGVNNELIQWSFRYFVGAYYYHQVNPRKCWPMANSWPQMPNYYWKWAASAALYLANSRPMPSCCTWTNPASRCISTDLRPLHHLHMSCWFPTSPVSGWDSLIDLGPTPGLTLNLKWFWFCLHSPINHLSVSEPGLRLMNRFRWRLGYWTVRMQLVCGFWSLWMTCSHRCRFVGSYLVCNLWRLMGLQECLFLFDGEFGCFGRKRPKRFAQDLNSWNLAPLKDSSSHVK